MARLMCGEGIPDFRAQEAIDYDDTCISARLDPYLKNFYEKIGYCKDMDDYGFSKDENGDPLIADCLTLPYYLYYGSKQTT